MIVVHKPNGGVTILGAEQEKLLTLVVDFAIAEGELQPVMHFGGTLDRVKALKLALQ